MTVKELREKLEGVPDDLEVTTRGHFGEAIRHRSYGWAIRTGYFHIVDYSWSGYSDSAGETTVFEIPNIDLGEEPD